MEVLLSQTTTENSYLDLPRLSSKQKLVLSSVSLPFFAEEYIVLENGVKFSFVNHPYLFDIYNDRSPYIVLQKATQMCITTWALISSVWSCLFRFKNGIGYFFPSKTDVMDFSKGRVEPFLQLNKFFFSLDITKNYFKDDAFEVENASIKRVGRALMYFRGLISKTGVKSIPLDRVVFDEVDESPQNAIDVAKKRIEHSEFKEIYELSNPSIENYGINKSFLKSSMKYWHLKCESCGKWQSLDLTFPKCLKRVGDDVIRVCVNCGAELYLDNPGKWISLNPSEKDISGYLLSHLYSKYVSPKTILDEYETLTGYKKEMFYRLRLGRAYTLKENKVDKEKILNLVENVEIPSDARSFMGIDQGKDLHITIIKVFNNNIYLKKAIVLTNFEDLDKVMKEENVQICVIDALPETREAKAFRDRHRGKVFLCYYNENQKGDYIWNYTDYTVSVNRTESLDDSQDLLMQGKLKIVPDIPLIGEFAEHCGNIARKITENEITGEKRFCWVEVGADHFRHAFNYSVIASKKVKNEIRIL